MKIELVFDAPLSNPNGLQATSAGLWIGDQIADKAFLVSFTDGALLREIETQAENISGLTYGAGALWLASNGRPVSRAPKPTDTGVPRIIKTDPYTGASIEEFPIPDGGGVHGIEWSAEGLWITTLASQTLSLVDPATFEVKRRIPVSEERAHGLACQNGAIWCVHTSHRIIVKLDALDGTELDRIEIPEEDLEPHGLTLVDNALWACDAQTGGIYRLSC